MPLVGIGQQRYPVVVEQLTSSTGPSGEPIETWALLATVWMSKETFSATEQFRTDQLSAKEGTHWQCTYLPALDPDLVDVPKTRRLVFQARQYDITHARVLGILRQEIECITLSTTKRPAATEALALGEWRYSDDPTIGDPGAGTFRVNTAARPLQTASLLALAATDLHGRDVSDAIRTVEAGNLLTVQTAAPSAPEFEVLRAPVAQEDGTWFRVALAHRLGAVRLTSGDRVTLTRAQKL